MIDECRHVGEIAFLGGDERQLIAARQLQQSGYRVTVKGLAHAEDWDQPTKEARIVVLAVSGMDSEGWLNLAGGNKMRLDRKWLAELRSDALILCGKTADAFDRWCQEVGVARHCYLQDQAFQAANAIPTAEGVIRLTYASRSKTIAGSRALVTGFGHCGKALAYRLQALGARVAIAVRSVDDQSYGRLMGLEMIDYSCLPQFAAQSELIYNTVPALVLTQAVLEQIPKEALLIDLASAPGGTDFAAARKLGLTAILAGNIPGRYFPETAGVLLAEHLEHIILKALASSAVTE